MENNEEISVLSEEYINWFMDFMKRKNGYYDFQNSTQLNPNKDTKYVDKIYGLWSLVDDYAKAYEIKPKESLFFPRPYRVVYYTNNGTEFKFLIYFGHTGVSACTEKDTEIENGEFISLNDIIEEKMKIENGRSKRK